MSGRWKRGNVNGGVSRGEECQPVVCVHDWMRIGESDGNATMGIIRLPRNARFPSSAFTYAAKTAFCGQRVRSGKCLEGRGANPGARSAVGVGAGLVQHRRGREELEEGDRRQSRQCTAHRVADGDEPVAGVEPSLGGEGGGDLDRDGVPPSV